MLAFVDTETTGLHADLHEIWEVAVILEPADRSAAPQEMLWQFRPERLDRADSFALQLGGFWARSFLCSARAPYWWGDLDEPPTAARIRAYDDPYPLYAAAAIADLVELTAGAHLVGAVVSFDEERLRRLAWSHHLIPRWHYHLVDVEALAAGRLGQAPPWRSDELLGRLGIEPPSIEDRHTALGDARWARRAYWAIMDGIQ